MYIVKRKYMIKIISLVLLLACVIVGIFISDHSENKRLIIETKKQKIADTMNILADFHSLMQVYEKSFTLRDFNNSKNEIYSLCKNLKSKLYNTDCIDVISWLNSLSQYTNTQMDDWEKNTEYLTKLKKSTDMLVEICADTNTENGIDKLNDLFKTTNTKEYHQNRMIQFGRQYSMLENTVKATRNETSSYAKDLLKHPLTPGVFKGNYIFPTSLNYYTGNSYADIFQAGKTLNRMAYETNRLDKTGENIDFDERAKIYLRTYAPYAVNCNMIIKEKISNTFYYVFSPEYSDENKNFINYDEQIKIAVNSTNGELKGFDATKYIKNHGTRESYALKPVLLPDSKSLPEDCTMVTQHNIIANRKCYKQFEVISSSGQKYFCIQDTNGTMNIYTKTELIRFLNKCG